MMQGSSPNMSPREPAWICRPLPVLQLKYQLVCLGKLSAGELVGNCNITCFCVCWSPEWYTWSLWDSSVVPWRAVQNPCRPSWQRVLWSIRYSVFSELSSACFWHSEPSGYVGFVVGFSGTTAWTRTCLSACGRSPWRSCTVSVRASSGRCTTCTSLLHLESPGIQLFQTVLPAL